MQKGRRYSFCRNPSGLSLSIFRPTIQFSFHHFQNVRFHIADLSFKTYPRPSIRLLHQDFQLSALIANADFVSCFAGGFAHIDRFRHHDGSGRRDIGADALR